MVEEIWDANDGEGKFKNGLEGGEHSLVSQFYILHGSDYITVFTVQFG